MVKAHSRETAHRKKLCLGKENPLRRRRSCARCLKRRVGVSGQEILGAVCAQVFSGSIKVAKLRRMLNASWIDPAPLKLFAIECRTLRGQPQRSLKACALHLFDGPLR